VDEADVYQLLAYALRYGCTLLELAYPQPSGTENFVQPPVFELHVAGLVGSITIKVKLVPLWSASASEHDHETAHFAEAQAA
jgi:5-methylcytosine-specific restriction enzyme subunit McrC